MNSGPLHAPAGPLFLLGSGLYLAWFGVHYWRSDVKWPTDPLKGVLRGQGLPPDAVTAVPVHAQLTADVQALRSGSSGSGAAAGSAAVSSTAGRNQQIAKLLAAPYGWSTGAQWDALVKLWDRESSWDNTARNPSSGAYGIPQALPPSKMPVAARPPSMGGSADPTTQVAWGLQYIQGRYGDPVTAWKHEQSAGWY